MQCSHTYLRTCHSKIAVPFFLERKPDVGLANAENMTKVDRGIEGYVGCVYIYTHGFRV